VVSSSLAYATLDDLSARWSAMPTDEASETMATTLLGDASFWLRQWFPVETAQMDAGQLDPTGAVILTCTMVKRALVNAMNIGVASATDTQGPYTTTRAFSNPDGALYITSNERTLIQGGGRMAAKSMTMGSPPRVAWHHTSINAPGPSLWPAAQVWPEQRFPFLEDEPQAP